MQSGVGTTGARDILGAPYTAETLELPDDDEGRVVATLVRRPAERRTSRPTDRAVLHVHGFADYFFQTAYAEWWTARGYDFYALDLRKYGRSILPHQTPNYVADLAHYHPELELAWDRVASGHRHVVLSGHSTGGLVLPLWADARRLEGRGVDARGIVLNAPWLDLQGKSWVRLGLTPVVQQVAKRQPRRIVPRTVTGLYARSLHRDHEGEWDFNLDWKPIASWPAYAGWLAAVRRGHATLHRGLSLGFPVLVLSSTRSSTPTELGEDVHSTDIVLDVTQIRRWSSSLGQHVTYVGIEGARHDVFLSREEPRARAFAELDRWLAAYVDG
ncbi:MAG TPA: alpha/beta hydrolase [Nocardioides sp.]|jgi:alpha-beta hydrolase superfamily lysophospholipase|nr:alpha/beta hydrolase [Nocardioides sp.]